MLRVGPYPSQAEAGEGVKRGDVRALVGQLPRILPFPVANRSRLKLPVRLASVRQRVGRHPDYKSPNYATTRGGTLVAL